MKNPGIWNSLIPRNPWHFFQRHWFSKVFKYPMNVFDRSPASMSYVQAEIPCEPELSGSSV